MFKYKISMLLLLTVLMVATAYCQGTAPTRLTKTIAGVVINVDSVGNVITVQAEDQTQMAFSVPDKTSITQQTHDIGLMDIRATDPVTIQYYASSPGKYTVVSIVDNKTVASP